MPHRGEMFLQAFAQPLPTNKLPPSYVTGSRVDVLRADQLDPDISGNKWFKLRYYLQEAKASGKAIVTYGGAWSNHILATAIACARLGISCTGIIRGEEPPTLSATLTRSRAAGMQLEFVSRTSYSTKILPRQFKDGDFMVIPEGGAGPSGVRGAATMADHITGAYSHCICAVGTGTMMAGLINALDQHTKLIGVPVLKNPEAADSIRSMLLTPSSHWTIADGYTFGGYARYNAELISFMNEFYRDTGIPSDFVYTGKLFFAARDLIRNGTIPEGSNVLLIHSGGLQGNAGLPPGLLSF